MTPNSQQSQEPEDIEVYLCQLELMHSMSPPETLEDLAEALSPAAARLAADHELLEDCVGVFQVQGGVPCRPGALAQDSHGRELRLCTVDGKAAFDIVHVPMVPEAEEKAGVVLSLDEGLRARHVAHNDLAPRLRMVRSRRRLTVCIRAASASVILLLLPGLPWMLTSSNSGANQAATRETGETLIATQEPGTDLSIAPARYPITLSVRSMDRFSHEGAPGTAEAQTLSGQLLEVVGTPEEPTEPIWTVAALCAIRRAKAAQAAPWVTTRLQHSEPQVRFQAALAMQAVNPAWRSDTMLRETILRILREGSEGEGHINGQ